MFFFDAIALAVFILVEVAIYLVLRRGAKSQAEIHRATLSTLGAMSVALGLSLWLSPWRGAYPSSLGFLPYLLVANVALLAAYAVVCAIWKYRTTPTAR